MTAVPGATPQASIARIIPLVFEFTARLITGAEESPSFSLFCLIFPPSSLFIKCEKSFSN